MNNMKKMFFALIFTITNLAHADAMTSNMILSNTVMLTSASLMTEDNPKEKTDFYINNHRVVENTSVDMHYIETSILKVKGIKEDFQGDTLDVKYSLNNKPYTFLEKTSLKSFPEKTAYVTVDKVEFKDKKATVYISVIDKAHRAELIKNHEGVVNIMLGVAAFFGFLMFLFVCSL